MKNTYLILYLLIFASLFYSCKKDEPEKIHDFWKQKADFTNLSRTDGISFSTNNLGYIGLGWSEEYKRDLWQYNPIDSSWTQKADFPGKIREGAACFTINYKSYIVGGKYFDYDFNKDSVLNDVWQYNSIEDAWVRLVDFPGNARWGAVTFVLNNLGYLSTGTDSVAYMKDLYKFNPENYTWTSMSNFGGVARCNAVAFTIGNKAYIGTGETAKYICTDDLWEYNPDTDKWSQKADFLGGERSCAISFSTDSTGFIALGWNKGSLFKDIWSYEPKADKWTVKEEFAGKERMNALCFKISDKVYVGGGFLNHDFWIYTP